MTIYAVVPVHNRIELTLQFLDSLDAQEIHEDMEVVIIDDGSVDGTTPTLQQRQGRFPITILSGNGSLWWAGCISVAIKFLLPKTRPEDFIYLANNDTILDRHHVSYLLETASTYANSLVGSCSQEVWPDESVHSVPGGFRIDIGGLSVTAIDESVEVKDRSFDALAGRGLLIPAVALPFVRLHPRLMPQHFADLALTQGLRSMGFTLLIDSRATSMQLDRAGSAVELTHRPRPSFNKKSPLYLPALIAFWWFVSPPRSRPSLPMKMSMRILRVTAGSTLGA